MTFYISDPLQKFGLGGASMDSCERMARDDFDAKAITLKTISNEEHIVDNPRRLAMKRPPPKISNQDWYQRRGYVVYTHKQNAWFETDPTGKAWGVRAVFLRKNLV
ncbi:Uu.00g028670.m01.CDS01 [Anthostomella pinea]|uniref:Uu.00g028670.m01.CDS01 n=1 Tax=Anthostomella pinea TaxID=933095 RepID=A0AAI8V7Y2_9PEZI|nr:Uu.00g028670.m01.CDS01 [Anthostomella pinea]